MYVFMDNVVGTHIFFYGDLEKIILWLSPNTHLFMPNSDPRVDYRLPVTHRSFLYNKKYYLLGSVARPGIQMVGGLVLWTFSRGDWSWPLIQVGQLSVAGKKIIWMCTKYWLTA